MAFDVMVCARMRGVMMTLEVMRFVRSVAGERRLGNDDRGEREYASAHEMLHKVLGYWPVRPRHFDSPVNPARIGQHLVEKVVIS